MELVEIISKHLKLSRKKLINSGLTAILEKKKAELLRDRLEILSRYKVKLSRELEKMIKQGKVEEHPGWEDFITLENIEEEIKLINGDIRKIRRNF
jgi:hypothetical protein